MGNSTRTVLWQHVRAADLCPGATTLDAWLDVRWIHVRLAGRVFPILPVWGYRSALLLHDVHHVLTGYDTRLRGELELAAWELASGGCRLHLAFWIDRIGALLLGILIAPRRCARAFRRGLRARNLYGERVENVLAEDFEQLRARVGGSARRPS